MSDCKTVGAGVAWSAHSFNVLLKYASFPRLGRASISVIFLLAYLASSIANAEIRRISSMAKDLSQVKKVYLHAKRVCAMEFSEPVSSVKIGNTAAIRAEISADNPREINLRLKYQSAEPTNLIVRVGRRVLVFDLIPSVNNHQDYIKINSLYGSPPYEEGKAHVVESVKLGGE